MAEKYSVKAMLSAVDNGFSAGMKKAIGLTSSFKDMVSSVGMGILQGVGQQIFSTVASSIGDMTGELNANNAAWKTFEGNMEMLGKSTAEIAAAKKELQAFATETIYSASDMATTFAQLKAVGIQNTTELVKGFGGLASAAENPQQAMKTLSQQATQMAAKPKVAWADFKLMLEQTPAGLAQVAKIMDMTTAELVSSVQKGTVATEDFFAAISLAAGSGTELNRLARQYKTVDQAVDGLKETVATKLAPTFSLFTDLGIKGVSGLIEKLDDLDGEAIASKVSGWIEDALPLWNSFQGAVSKTCSVAAGAAKELWPLVAALGIKDFSLKGVLDDLAAMDVETVVDRIGTAVTKAKPYWDTFVEMFHTAGGVARDVLPPVLSLLGDFGAFFLDNSEMISKGIPYIILAVLAFKGFDAVGRYVPGMRSFAATISTLATGGIKGLASMLFGVAAGQKATGKASRLNAKNMMASAQSFLMIGGGVALAAAGFALLAQSAIALAGAGAPAVAVMAGLTLGLGGLMVGLMAAMKYFSMAPKRMQGASLALLAIGAAMLLVSVGFALMAQSAIALAGAGTPAVAIMFGMVAAMALLAIGAAALGAGLTAAAPGLLAFGGAIALMGVGAVLAGAGLLLVANSLPLIAAYGSQAAEPLMELGGSLAEFALGAALAAVPLLALSASLLVISVAMVAFGVGALLAAASLAIITPLLPQLAAHGMTACGECPAGVPGRAGQVFHRHPLHPRRGAARNQQRGGGDRISLHGSL